MQTSCEDVKYPPPRRSPFRRPSSPVQGMDNQAFRSSRDSNISSEASSPYHDDTITSLDLKLIENSQIEVDNEFKEAEKTHGGVEPQFKDNLEVKKRSQNGQEMREGHLDEINVTVSTGSALPLLDSLQGYGVPMGNKGPLVPPRKKSRDSSVDKNKEMKMFTERQALPEIRHNHHDSYHSIDLPSLTHSSLANQDVKCFREQSTRTKVSRSVQAWPPPPYRLRVLPRRMSQSSGWRPLGRWIFSQAGMAILLILWAMAGAAAFRYTEGPREEKASEEMVSEQKFLVNELMTELMQSDRNEIQWRDTLERYMSRHEAALALRGGAGEGPAQGRVWTLPGCILFAVSLITTLGFGAPVPRTSAGRAVAVVFAAVGIPLHLLLVLNIGMVIAVKLQTFAQRNSKTDEEDCEEDSEDMPKNDDKLADITRRSNGIIIKHRRTGSEPIGRQAITNISREANFIISDPKDNNCFDITEVDLNFDATESKKAINDFIPKSCDNKETRYNICTFKNLQKLDKEDRKIFKDIGSQPNLIPTWLKSLPFVGIAVYYTIGVLLFGFARYEPFLDSLMFPLDFTVAGGVATTSGYIRVLYALYLEGAVVLAAITVAVLQVSATQGLTDLGLRFGLLTNSR